MTGRAWTPPLASWPPARRCAVLALLALASLLAACVATPPPERQPEAASGYSAQPGRASTRFAVAAANPLAADAGSEMLRAGGSAVDAAIAVQMVLALVEPQSSGLGGGTFLLHFNGHAVEAFDGRETAPAAADERLLLGDDGKPLAFHEAAVGGRSVGTPGTLRVLELAHREYGRLPWAALFRPAIALAETGFRISPRLHALVRADPHLGREPTAAAYFFDRTGAPRPVGSTLRNPELAALLRRIAAEGADAFYRGEVAQAIVAKVRSHPTNPGRLSLDDLAGYQAKKRAPICHDHRARAHDYRICGFPPPGSGAIAVGQILGILAHTGAAALGPEDGRPSAHWLHLYTEAARLAFADRAQYLGDPDFVPAPPGGWPVLLEPAYLSARARLVADRRMQAAPPGTPGQTASRYAPSAEQVEYGTSHVSIVDGWGNALAMTTTIEDQFGSRQMVRGFLLNNELTDFSFAPTDGRGQPVANRVQPGKRPRSSMAPTLVFDRAGGTLVFSGGSSGGAMIIHHVAKTLYGVLHWGLDVQQAIALPNFGVSDGPLLLERGRFPGATVQALQARGHPVREQDMTSGLHAIQRRPGGFFSGADPRREGTVRGD